MYIPVSSLFTWVLLAARIQARCYDPTPTFQLPKSHTYTSSTTLSLTFQNINDTLQTLISQVAFNISSFSVEVTTSEETVWSLHHTARERNPDRLGAKQVGGGSVYRLASITKAFTTLAIIQQHIAGNLSLDDPIQQYIPELEGSNGDIPWKDITLRITASQLSGIPREFAQAEFLNFVEDPTAWGFPPVAKEGVPQCDEYYGYDRPCEREDLFVDLVNKKPLWPPKQKSTYSNLNFVLLGLVVQNVTGLSYTEYVEESILRPLNMTRSSFVKPNDSIAVLLPGDNYWDIEEGIQRPTGGLYSTTSDLSKFLRYVLTHYNGLSPQFNWFQPASYSTTLSSFFGMPWEIFRTNSILPFTSKPTTFVTKGGSVPGYYSNIIMLPDYDLGISILTSGPDNSLMEQIREMLTVPLVEAAEEVAQSDLSTRYTGLFKAKDLNSTLILSHTSTKYLYVESFISNSTDVLTALLPFYTGVTHGDPFRVQLVPTLLYKDEENQKGELWRGVIVPEKRDGGLVWDDVCITNDDPTYYGGLPVYELVLWGGEDGRGVVQEVELSAFRIKLGRVQGNTEKEDEKKMDEQTRDDERLGHMRPEQLPQQIILGRD